MKVILLDEIKGKGGEGDVVEVAQGYAENFLFPKKLAVAATKGNLKQLDERRNNIAKREAVRLATANETKAALEGKQVTVDVKVGDEGILFGSVTAAMAQLVRPSALPSCSFVAGITRHRQLPVFAKPIARRTELAAASPATRMILAFLARAAEPTGSSPISTRPAL